MKIIKYSSKDSRKETIILWLQSDVDLLINKEKKWSKEKGLLDKCIKILDENIINNRIHGS
jgi:hypothetical protein